MALDKLTKVQSVGISSFIQVVGVVTATQGFDGNITGIITATGDFSIADKIVHTGDTNTALRFPAADTFTVETAGSERFRVESGGNIGIGTNNANNLLHVYGGQIKAQSNPSDTSTNLDLIRAQCGSSGNALFSIRAADAADNNSNWDIKTNANEDLTFTIGGATERLRITSDGGVGIGTDTPYANNSFNSLSIGGSGKYGLIELNKSDGVAGSWIDVYGNNGNGDLRITTAGTSGAITFWTGGSFTEKVRIASNGLVGIATAVPSYRLDIGDGATDPANGYQLRVNASGDYIFALQRQSVPSFSIRNNSTGIVHLNTQNSKILSLGVSSGNASGSIEDDVRIDSNGHLTIVDGNLVVASGHGIDFSATGNGSGTMSSELLDDYEEGSWTPDLQFGGAKVGISYNNQYW